RDLKPANIVLMDVEGTTDFVKLVDFGISKVKASSSNLTKPSVMMGTPKYMAPEQASGRVENVDHRTDQWALACITWEMLSGREPFVAGDVPGLMTEIIHGELPPLTSKVGRIVPEVEVTLRRALSKRQSERFPTITAFARALGNASTTLSLTPTPTPVKNQTAKAEPRPARQARRSSPNGQTVVGGLFARVMGQRPKPSVVDRTMALGQRALDAIVPSRRKRPWHRRAWPYVTLAVILAGAAGLFYLWANETVLPGVVPPAL
ncbi:MAG TPA: protein kinase, partial [Polyangia bacterium]|nr:protein kinase [Polyangia bacterium]